MLSLQSFKFSPECTVILEIQASLVPVQSAHLHDFVRRPAPSHVGCSSPIHGSVFDTAHAPVQAAEASSRLVAANARMGNAAMAASAFHQQLPCICAAAPLKLRASVLGAMADALLAEASEADIQDHPDRCFSGCLRTHEAIIQNH